MSTTRRGFIGWVAALFGGAAVAKVAPAEATELVEYTFTHRGQEPVTWTEERPVFKHVATNPEPFGYEDSWDARPIQEMLDEHAANVARSHDEYLLRLAIRPASYHDSFDTWEAQTASRCAYRNVRTGEVRSYETMRWLATTGIGGRMQMAMELAPLMTPEQVIELLVSKDKAPES